jgi:6-phosphofructokinase
MKNQIGNLLYGQSGGPTSVINATAYGVITAALRTKHQIDKVYCMHNGIDGAIHDDLFCMNEVPFHQLELLKQTPGVAFGSARHKMKDYRKDESEYIKIFNVFQKYNIRFFLFNGGNDSMDTCQKIDDYLAYKSYRCQVIGLPKTIDNDLVVTDHCPGYGSAAKFIANTMMEIAYDTQAYSIGKVTIVEVMGRNSGWLTAAASLASLRGYGPDLIYLPEVPFSKERFQADVQTIYDAKKRCLVAVSEGICDVSGVMLGETDLFMDAFGHGQLGGVSHLLANQLQIDAHLPCRSIELNLPQRCGAHLQSLVDVQEAIATGETGVRYALEGISGVMVCMKREMSPAYRLSYFPHPVHDIANGVKTLPREMINKEGNQITPLFYDYALPLIQGEPDTSYQDGLICLY